MTSELLNMPANLREPFITRMMELTNVRRAEFMTRMRRFEVSARGEDGPQVGDVINISRALEEYIGTRFVPPPWRPHLDFGGSDLEEERFHGPMEVEDSEEAVRQQAAMEDDLPSETGLFKDSGMVLKKLASELSSMQLKPWMLRLTCWV